MAVESGWTNLQLAPDPPFASPFPLKDPKDSKQTSVSRKPAVVLLVEDNDPDIYVIRELLLRGPVPIDLHIVRDGAAALAYLDDEKNPCPELVLLDLNLPKLGGIEVLRRMRNGQRCGQTPVIVVSSSDSDTDRNATKNLGAQAYFRKPADLKTYSNLADLVVGFLSAKGGA